MPHRPFDLTDFWQQLDVPGWPPEYSLLVAVLKRAVLDYLDDRLPMRTRLDAGEFLFSGEECPWTCWWIFSMVFDEPEAPYDRLLEYLREHPWRPEIKATSKNHWHAIATCDII